MKSSKFLKAALVLMASVFIINQLVSSLYMPIKTETAVFHTATDGLKITGQIIRDEILVTSNSDGVLHFVISDGIRVSKNGVIANVYSSEEASLTVSQMYALKNKIEDIEGILSYNDVEATNLELINEKIDKSLSNMIYSFSNGNYDGLEGFSEDLLSACNRKQAALGVTTGLSDRLSALKKEYRELNNSLPSATGKICAKESGYFVSNTDGYETVLRVKDLAKMTPEYLSDITPKANNKNVIGKIVLDYEWYIAAKVSINDSLQYKEGQTLKLLTSVKSSPTLSVRVDRINISDSQETAVIIFACSDMNSELAAMRSGMMTVVSKEYSGLRVSQKALRVVDSVRGVYVQNGMQVNFVPVEILYRNDNYIICEKQNKNGAYLKLYDKVVVKGKNLYDGKIVG